MNAKPNFELSIVKGGCIEKKARKIKCNWYAYRSESKNESKPLVESGPNQRMDQGIATSAKLDHSIVVKIVMWNIAFHRLSINQPILIPTSLIRFHAISIGIRVRPSEHSPNFDYDERRYSRCSIHLQCSTCAEEEEDKNEHRPSN